MMDKKLEQAIMELCRATGCDFEALTESTKQLSYVIPDSKTLDNIANILLTQTHDFKDGYMEKIKRVVTAIVMDIVEFGKAVNAIIKSCNKYHKSMEILSKALKEKDSKDVK